MRYRCVHCNEVYERDSDKAWIKSYCTKTDKYVRLMKEENSMTREEIETTIVDELEFLLRWESNLPDKDQDKELINAVLRVLQEFKVKS
jgi:phage FluMu protein Com